MYINGVYVPEEQMPSSSGIPTYGIQQANLGAEIVAGQQGAANVENTKAETNLRQAETSQTNQQTTESQLNSLMKFSGPAMYGIMTADPENQQALYDTYRAQVAKISPNYVRFVPPTFDRKWVSNTFNESQDPSKLMGLGLLNQQAQLISGKNLPGVPNQNDFLNPGQTPTQPGKPIDMSKPFPGTNIPRQTMLDALIASQTDSKGAAYATDRALFEPAFVQAQNAGKTIDMIGPDGNTYKVPLDVWQQSQGYQRPGTAPAPVTAGPGIGGTPQTPGGPQMQTVTAPKSIQTPEGQKTIQAPVAQVYSTPPGVTPDAFKYLPKSPQQALAMGGIVPPVGANKYSPAQKQMQEDQVNAATKYEGDVSKRATSAQAMGANIDAAYQSLQGFTPNRFASYQRTFEQVLNGLSGGQFSGQLKDTDAFNKNITDMVRTTIPGLGGRAAWSEVSYLKDAFPSMNLSDAGAHFMLGEFAAVRHDYPLAEQQFMTQYKQMYGTNVGAEAVWNRNVSAPMAYMLKYASEDDNRKLAAYLQQSPQGRDMAQRMVQTKNFLQTMGLWNNQ